MITLPSFEKHIAELRASKRFTPERIFELLAGNRKGGADFFSSQVIVQEHISGFGTFDLRLFHGLSSADTKYRNVTAWTCEGDDYPIVYFVGFRVRTIEPPDIRVMREKDIVNVISLKGTDAELNKHTRVKLFQQDTVLCDDLARGCTDGIFYQRHD